MDAARPPATTLLEVDALSKRLAGRTVIDRVSFGVAAGQAVGLLGPNGAGKTTCMRVICGYLAPSGGRVRIGGCDVLRDGLAARRLVGYLPEHAPLYPELRVREQLAYRARLGGLRGRRVRAEVERVIERCGLRAVDRRVIGQLSRGYRQRVGLAQALLGAPPLLVLDEPTAGLDPNQLEAVRELIRSLAGTQAVLLSSHLLAEVEAICSELVLIDHGVVVAQGALAALSEGDGGVLVVTIRGASAAVRARLETLPGVGVLDAIELAGRPGVGRYRLSGASARATREGLAQSVVAAGWGLQELRVERTPLAQAFADLTRGDAARDARAGER
ncbi:MAG: ATP-binding cassette domain-containing protein [Proteobacteria bacterium]|nr:ATP-binding cassette domain-containing protein [Pseudomonadota bacterium]